MNLTSDLQELTESEAAAYDRLVEGVLAVTNKEVHRSIVATVLCKLLVAEALRAYDKDFDRALGSLILGIREGSEEFREAARKRDARLTGTDKFPA